MIKQTAKQIAKQAAKQLAQEPLEILKDAREQIEGTQTPEQNQEQGSERPKGPTPEETAKKEAKSQRLMQAYTSEIEDIRKRDLFKDLQRRISEGEDLPVEEYQELSIEERQVLEAQKQAVQAQKAQAVEQRETPLQIISKKGRKMFGKVGLKREQTKIEMRQPPSS